MQPAVSVLLYNDSVGNQCQACAPERNPKEIRLYPTLPELCFLEEGFYGADRKWGEAFRSGRFAHLPVKETRCSRWMLLLTLEEEPQPPFSISKEQELELLRRSGLTAKCHVRSDV